MTAVSARILLLDDHPAVRQGLSILLATRGRAVVGESDGSDGEAALSERERQVLEMMGEGQGSAEIAHALEIGPRTVETYHARTAEKLGLSGALELRKYAISRRIEKPYPILPFPCAL